MAFGKGKGYQGVPDCVPILHPDAWEEDRSFMRQLCRNPHIINTANHCSSPAQDCGIGREILPQSKHHRWIPVATKLKAEARAVREAKVMGNRKLLKAKREALLYAKKIEAIRAKHNIRPAPVEEPVSVEESTVNNRALRDATSRSNWFAANQYIGTRPMQKGGFITVPEGSTGHLNRIDSPNWLFIHRQGNADCELEVTYQWVGE